MKESAFDPDFEDLPETLPVFPLGGALLLPRGKLPLNIFEPRYLSMIFDVLAGHRMIGMVQPRGERRDGDIYETGCAGRITSFSEAEDGRVLITLSGLIRFQVARELPLGNGYRRVEPNFAPFSGDLELSHDCGISRSHLVDRVKQYFSLHGLTANWDAVDNTGDEKLIATLAMISPFSASEKQALLEAPSLQERARTMLTLMEMAILDRSEQEADADQIRH